jgi:hypothetical protein
MMMMLMLWLELHLQIGISEVLKRQTIISPVALKDLRMNKTRDKKEERMPLIKTKIIKILQALAVKIPHKATKRA